MSVSIALLSAAMLPKVECASGLCVSAPGQWCWDGEDLIEDFKHKIGIDG